jgi:gliding motility-associated-like protein
MKTKLLTLLLLFYFIGTSQDVVLSGAVNCGAPSVAGAWVVPCGVTSITVEVYGAGGGGGGGGGGSMGGSCPTIGGGGGGGGGYAAITINVIPGSNFNYSVGSGGCGGSNGGDLSNGSHGNSGGNSSFSGLDAGSNPINLIANGGARGDRGNTCSPWGSGNPGNGGAGGSANGGSTNTVGLPGSNGIVRTNTSVPSNTVGGSGGNGAGPSGGQGGPETNNDGSDFGGGGAGGGDSRGGHGAKGAILIYFNGAINLSPAPVITSTPPTCNSNGTSTISNFSSNATYVFTPAGPTVGIGGIINNMIIGTSYTVIALENGCDSNPSSAFSNQAQTPPPVAPVISSTLSTCTSSGTNSISNFDSNLSYIFSPSGPSIDANGLILNMSVGQSYTVVSSDGSCNSSPSNPFSVQAQLSAPSAPIVSSAQPSCSSNGVSTITNYDNSLSYTFFPAGPSIVGAGTIIDMSVGQNYTVISNNGNCNSNPSGPFSIQAQLPVPITPVISSSSPTCTSAGSSLISNFNLNVSYSFSPSGPTVGVGGLISGMDLGVTYTVTAIESGCSSQPSIPFVNLPVISVPEIPLVSVSLPDCYAEGDAQISNYNNQLSYVFSPSGPTVDLDGRVNGMNFGVGYTLVATEGACSSNPSDLFSVLPRLNGPTANITGNLNPCRGISTTLTANGGIDYFWIDELGRNIGLNDNVTVSDGVYSVVVSNFEGCSDTMIAQVQSIDCSSPCTLKVPNAFTPDNNGVNDFFKPVYTCDLQYYEMFVYNRWGELVYTSNNFLRGWDGIYKGLPSMIGEYVWFINYSFESEENFISLKGSVSLIR